jgi:Na+/proline symporter
MPVGLVGLLFAMIFFAAMSSTSSELNALASTTTVDMYKRLFKQDGTEKQYLIASKCFTAFWGVVAILFASFGSLAENLIQFVNIIGSLFYGTILGIFLVAFYFKFIKANAVFIAAIITETIIIFLYYQYIMVDEQFSFLWLNLIGTVGVILIGFVLQMVMGSGDENAKTLDAKT